MRYARMACALLALAPAGLAVLWAAEDDPIQQACAMCFGQWQKLVF